MIVGNTAVDGIALSRGTNSGVGGGLKQFEPAGGTIMYVFCGPQRNCGQSPADAVETGSLLRRESLELALYTFKYVGGVNHVIAFMPPTPGNAPKYVIYLQKNDLQAQLKLPLARTLGAKVPLPSTITPREQQAIDAVTESRVYSFSLSQAQQGDAILVLSPLAA